MRSLVGRVCAAVLVASAALTLVGCIPLPVPAAGYLPASRSNLPDRQPEFIVPGKTTRQDVLLQLGSPDSEGEDRSWIVYSSLLDAGGYVLADPTLRLGVGKRDIVERQLVVRFGADSVVTEAAFKEVRCQLGTVDLARWDTGACLPLEPGESASADLPMQPEAEAPIATFENMRFVVPNARTTAPGQQPLSRLFLGTLSLTRHALIFEAKSSVSLDNPPLPRLRIPYTSITDLHQIVGAGGRVEAVAIYTRSGFVYRIQVFFGSLEALFGPIPSDATIGRFIAELHSLSGLAVRGP
jgi:hypothetical protein